jgi:hypothetical protein
MAATQWNGNKNADERPNFEPPVYTQEIFTAPNDSYKLLLNVQNFNGYVRVGISKKFWCAEKDQYLFAPKVNCYFPIAVCEELVKYLPIAKAEAERLERSIEKPINGYTGAATKQHNCGEPYVNRCGYAQLANAQVGRLVEQPRGRLGDVTDSIFAIARGKPAGATRGRPRSTKPRTNESGYKTEVQEESVVVEQAPAKKRKVVSAAATQTVE